MHFLSSVLRSFQALHLPFIIPHSHHKDFGAKPDFKASQAFTLERHCEIWNRRDLAVNHVLVGAQRAIC